MPSGEYYYEGGWGWRCIPCKNHPILKYSLRGRGGKYYLLASKCVIFIVGNLSVHSRNACHLSYKGKQHLGSETANWPGAGCTVLKAILCYLSFSGGCRVRIFNQAVEPTTTLVRKRKMKHSQRQWGLWFVARVWDALLPHEQKIYWLQTYANKGANNNSILYSAIVYSAIFIYSFPTGLLCVDTCSNKQMAHSTNSCSHRLYVGNYVVCRTILNV